MRASLAIDAENPVKIAVRSLRYRNLKEVELGQGQDQGVLTRRRDPVNGSGDDTVEVSILGLNESRGKCSIGGVVEGMYNGIRAGGDVVLENRTAPTNAATTEGTPRQSCPAQIAIRNGDQPDWVLAVRTVGGGAELMHDFKACARLADAVQHSAVVAPTVKLSAIQISVGAFRQKAGRVAAGIVVVRAGRKSVQQSELPAGRDFEDRPPCGFDSPSWVTSLTP